MWDHDLYSVDYILNKHWLASSNADSIGRTTRQEVEVCKGEQENSGKKEAHSSAVVSKPQKQDVIASKKKVLSHVDTRDKKNWLIYIIRANTKSELMGQSVYS